MIRFFLPKIYCFFCLNLNSKTLLPQTIWIGKDHWKCYFRTHFLYFKLHLTQQNDFESLLTFKPHISTVTEKTPNQIKSASECVSRIHFFLKMEYLCGLYMGF